MPTFPLRPLEHPDRVPTPPELCHCLAQLLPPLAPPEAADLLPMVVPLLAVLRLWNVQLRSAARLALDVVSEEDGQLRRRLRVLGRQKIQDALELKLHGFGVMVGLWRIQTVILSGTTAKADLQPLIDELFPPAPLPDYFLASDVFGLSPERRREIGATILRTRKTCQTLRKRAAIVAGAYTGPAEGLRAALLAAKISDGPIGLEPADFAGDDGTARAVLSQAASVRSLWDEMTSLFSAPVLAPKSTSSAVERATTPVELVSSQETVIEDSQKSTPAKRPPSTHASPARRSPRSPPRVGSPSRFVPAGAAAALQEDFEAAPSPSSIPVAPAPAPARVPLAPPRARAPGPRRPRSGSPLSAAGPPSPLPVVVAETSIARPLAVPPAAKAPLAPAPSKRPPGPPPAPRHRVTSLIDRGPGGRSIVSARRPSSYGHFDPPSRPAPTSTVAPPRPATNPVKRALNRTSGRGAFDRSSDDDDDDDEALLPPRKQARLDLSPTDGRSGSNPPPPPPPSRSRPPSSSTLLFKADSAHSLDLRATAAATGGGSQGTDSSNLGYVDLLPETVPRPRPLPLSASVGGGGGARDVRSGQARGEFRQN